MSPLNVTKANALDGAQPVLVVLDQSLATSSGRYAVHAASSEKSIFLPGTDIAKYLESTGADLKIVDFSKLGTGAAGGSAAAGAAKTAALAGKGPAGGEAAAAARARHAEAAKIPEAELIGITVRKDGDFSEWYQQVLKKGDMLEYYDVSGCYILKPWSYNVWQAIQSEQTARRVPRWYGSWRLTQCVAPSLQHFSTLKSRSWG